MASGNSSQPTVAQEGLLRRAFVHSGSELPLPALRAEDVKFPDAV
jgi:hypothetical protein